MLSKPGNMSGFTGRSSFRHSRKFLAGQVSRYATTVTLLLAVCVCACRRASRRAGGYVGVQTYGRAFLLLGAPDLFCCSFFGRDTVRLIPAKHRHIWFFFVSFSLWKPASDIEIMARYSSEARIELRFFLLLRHTHSTVPQWRRKKSFKMGGGGEAKGRIKKMGDTQGFLGHEVILLYVVHMPAGCLTLAEPAQYNGDIHQFPFN